VILTNFAQFLEDNMDMNSWFLPAFLFLTIALSPAHAESLPLMPHLEGETLLEKPFKIPEDFQNKKTWLILGFSKDSQKSTTQCAEKLSAIFKDQGYSAALLQGAPFFIKGVIKNSIRSTVPETRRSRFLILNEGRDELQKFAGFIETAKDDAYIIGLSPNATKNYEVTFKYHGSCDEAQLNSVTQMIRDHSR
jgi:hypothetical protein